LAVLRTGIDVEDLLVNRNADHSDSDSEIGDEEDEDSNEEGHRGNDYPDETTLSDYEEEREEGYEDGSGESDYEE